MKKILSVLTIGILSFSLFSILFAPQVNAQSSLKVLIDEGHSEWLVSGNAQKLIQALQNKGYVIDSFSGTVTQSLLSSYNVFLIGVAWISFTDSEIQAIENFVQNGGGLWLIGLGWSWVDYHPYSTIYEYPMNEIAQRFGAFYNPDIIFDPTDYMIDPSHPIFHTPFIEIHPITSGVSFIGATEALVGSISIETGTILITGDDDSYGGYHESPYPDPGMNPPVLAAIYYGSGKVIIQSHDWFSADAHIDEYHNKILSLNIVDWLLTHEGVMITPRVPLIGQETSGSCWAACSQMILEYYGLYGPNVSQIQIARETDHEEWYQDGIHIDLINTLTWIWQGALERLGKVGIDVEWTWPEGGLSFDDIKEDVDQNEPIIALWGACAPASPIGHTVVIVGYIDNPGEDDDWVIFNNPDKGDGIYPSLGRERQYLQLSQFKNQLATCVLPWPQALRTTSIVEKNEISIHFTESEFGGFRRYSASSSTWSFWWFMLRKWNGGWASIADAPDHYQQGSWSASVNIAINGQGNYRLQLWKPPLLPTTWEINIEFVARALGFRAQSPLNLLVTDPSGSSTGYDSVLEQMVNEIPRATYSGPSSEPQLIVITDPLDGEYIVLLTGTNSGTYTLTVDLVLPEGITTKTHAGEIVEDAVYVYSVSITDEEMTASPDPEAELEHLKEFIDGLPDDAFDKPNLTSQRKNAPNKIDEVALKVEAGNYTDAVNKLLYDIRAKMDGDPAPKDWVICQTSELCIIIDHIIDSIETLQE